LQGDLGLAGQMIATFTGDGLTVAEVAWQEPGIWGSSRPRTMACRFATVARWAYDNVHSSAGVFVAQGTSGGASQVAFALTYYGLGDILDLANIGSGPPLCPLCPFNSTNLEPLLPRGGAATVQPQLGYRSTVRIFLGANEESPDIVADANAYFSAITSAKSMTRIPGTGHHIEETQNGINAYIQSVRSALR